MIAKVLDAIWNIITTIVWTGLVIVCAAPYVVILVLCTVGPYYIWSEMFYLLPDKALKFAVLTIPAFIGSWIALYIGCGVVAAYGDHFFEKYIIRKKQTPEKENKTSKAKETMFKLFLILTLAVEIGLAYIYPASEVVETIRHGNSGNGYSSGYSTSGGSSNSNNKGESLLHRLNKEEKDSSAWEYFEKKNRIGDAYKEVLKDYPDMNESGNSGGGVFLQVNDNLYFSFPRLTKSDISDTDPCTGMTGIAEELFGLDEDVTVDKFRQNLGLTSETVYDGNLNYKKTSYSGYYYVVILDVDITSGSDHVKPDTWISVIQRDREIIRVGRLASDQNATETTVYYVDDGDRYHRDASCSTLRDSDTIYECYIGDVPEGRTPCGVCY